MPIDHVDTAGISNEFKDFLDIENNSRIMFSGIFGSGKTTFIKDFFTKTFEKEYFVFHLFPTNYTANRNEDVFELVKYDILYELLKEKPYLEKLELSYLDIIPTINNIDNKTVGKFIELLPQIGKPIKVIKDYLDQKIEESSVNEGKDIKKYIKEKTGQQGSVYEHDAITQLIINITEREKKDRKSVLIIDDLDRIDPDNIFRLLNVFSVHLDLQSEYANKFNFDKVIFCCDIENIRKIFHNRFGGDVDFNGYIDKFYSTDIFEFDIKSELKEASRKILQTIAPSKGKLWTEIRKESTKNFQYVGYIIECMIESGTFSLRHLVKLNNYIFIEKRYSIPLIYNIEGLHSNNIYIFAVLEFLTTIFGGHEVLLKLLSKTLFRVDRLTGTFIQRLIVDLIVVSEHKNNKFLPYTPFNSLKYNIEYQIITGGNNSIAGEIKGKLEINSINDSIDIKGLLIDALNARQEIKGLILRDR